jgi:hypothetical protein
MRYVMMILFAWITMSVSAQTKDVRTVLANTKELERVVFETKDSLSLERLFGRTLTYEHSSGKIENRSEAIQGIIHNKSVYTPVATGNSYDVSNRKDTIAVMHIYKAKEKKADGTTSDLDIIIETVWGKEKGNWKLFRRKAAKNH